MKIIAGYCRGMTIATPKGVSTRPTLARVREAVMSMLAPRLEGAVFFDLYAGSGAIGLEAVSRGASRCYFVEDERSALTALRQNVQECERRFKAQNLPQVPLHILPRRLADAWRDLGRAPRADVIWADPPYAAVKEWLNEALLDKLSQVTQPGSVFVLEAAASDLAGLTWGQGDGAPEWERSKEKVYGDTAVIIWQRQEEAEHGQGTETE